MPEPLRLDLPREELVFSPGVIPALYQIVEDLVKPDHGKVLTMTPAYGFFLHACEYNGVELVTSPLRKVAGRFEMDWEDFRRKAADPDVRVPLHHAVGALAQMRVLHILDALQLRHHLGRIHQRTAPLLRGVDLEIAQPDSFYWALYCSDSTMEAVRATEERYRRCLLRQHQHEERQQSAAVFHGQRLSARQRQPRPSI